jgi:PAS domain S-box-containing protein
LSYFAAGRVGLALAITNASVSTVWPPAGIALAVLLLGGYRYWPAITVGAFAVNLMITGDPFSSAAIAGGNTLEGLVGAWLTVRYAGGASAVNRPSDLLRFVLLGALASTMIAAAVGVATLTIAGLSPLRSFAFTWGTWWLGDAIGVIEVTPLVLVVAERARAHVGWPDRAAGTEAAVVGAVALGIDLVVFLRPAGSALAGYPLIFLVLPPIVWAAFRFGPLGASLAGVALSVVAIAGTLLLVGPFAPQPVVTRLLDLRFFLGTVIVTGLLVGAERYQRLRAEAALAVAGHDLERRVRERTATLAAAQSIGRLGSWELDLQTREVTWSDEMYRIYGYGEERFPVTFTSALDRVIPEDQQRIRTNMLTLRRLPDPAAAESPANQFRIRLPDGTIRVLEGRGRIVRTPGEAALRMMGTVQDITDRVAMVSALEDREAELLRSNRELEQFAYVASHDLQEPLGLVEGYTKLVQERYAGRLDADADEFLTYARRAAVRMRELIDDLLSFSRLAPPRQPFPRIDATVALDEALASLGATIQEAHAEVRRETPLPQVSADPSALARVFQNLLSNAIKFRSDRPPEIRISAERFGDGWRFSVADNGIGIPPEYHEQIFAIFQRLHTREQYPGTGMGLAIAKKIVEALGGRIWVDSDGIPGKGSTFHFTIPDPTQPLGGSSPLGGTPHPSTGPLTV